MSNSNHHRSLTRPRSGAGPRARAARLDAGDRRPGRARAGARRRRAVGADRGDRGCRGRERSPASRCAARPSRQLDRSARQQRLAAEGADGRPGCSTARARPLPDLGRCGGCCEVNVLAPLALIQAALPGDAGRRRGDQHHLRRCRRAVRGVGWIRILEGGARPADRDPCRRAAAPARLRGRPRRHAYADAPGGISRRGHLRPAAARGQRARAARTDRGQRPSGRYSARALAPGEVVS